MNVVVIGATGFIGGYLLDELVDRGHRPVALVRPGREGRLRSPERCQHVSGDVNDDGAVREAVSGCDAVIYNVGILREFPSRGITYRSLHFEGARRAMDAAESEGVRRFLLMSANGVKAGGTEYQRTKHAAEEHLRGTKLDWTIFRPSVVFGDPRGRIEFATQLYRDVIRPPLPAPLFYDGFLPVNAGTFRMSPVHVQDVATVFVKALTMPETVGQTYALGGEDKTWRDIIQTIGQAVGTTKLTVPVPIWTLKPAAALLDRYAFFPITRDQLVMLMEGNTCDSTAVFETFGIDPMPFDRESLSYLV